jgi:hypothetical protein
MDRILSLSRCNPLARGEFFKIRLRFTPDPSSWSDIAWWTCMEKQGFTFCKRKRRERMQIALQSLCRRQAATGLALRNTH